MCLLAAFHVNRISKRITLRNRIGGDLAKRDLYLLREELSWMDRRPLFIRQRGATRSRTLCVYLLTVTRSGV